MNKQVFVKKFKNTTYEIRFNNGKYFVYQRDEQKDDKFGKILELGFFNSEKEAKEYIEKFKS